MAKTHDISFQLSDGTEYGFMLARADGKKAWAVNRVFRPPPSLVKQRVDIVITAREDEIAASAVRQLKRMEEILADLEKIMASTGNIVLTGLDNLKYPVLIDQAGLQINTLIHEKQREPEYQVAILCWGLYE